ncbi:MAG: hypothetical protein HY873_13855 [Chloroflexi bacterium]|nr:hypothetical protein [Chloroflexota bacterium]
MVSRHKTKVWEMSPEMLWFQEHPQELATYEGKWVAIKGGKVIASGDSASGVIKRLNAGNEEDALLSFVGPEDCRPDTYFVG